MSESALWCNINANQIESPILVLTFIAMEHRPSWANAFIYWNGIFMPFRTKKCKIISDWYRNQRSGNMSPITSTRPIRIKSRCTVHSNWFYTVCFIAPWVLTSLQSSNKMSSFIAIIFFPPNSYNYGETSYKHWPKQWPTGNK